MSSSEYVPKFIDGAPVPEWLSITQACAYVQVSRRTIYHWIKDGKLSVARTPSGLIRIKRDSLIKES